MENIWIHFFIKWVIQPSGPIFTDEKKNETKLTVEPKCIFRLNVSLALCRCVLHSPPRAEGSTGGASGTNHAASSPAAGGSTGSASQEKDSPTCKLTDSSHQLLRQQRRFNRKSWTLIQCFFFFSSPFPAEQVDGATVSSQPADSTSAASDTERHETMDEGVVVLGEDGEPNAAELRRRRLRKLETAAAASSSSSSPPPPDNWSRCSDSDILLWTNRNSELIGRCFGSSLPLFLVALAFHRLRFLTVSSWTQATRGWSLPLIWTAAVSESNSTTFFFFFFCLPTPPRMTTAIRVLQVFVS